jgi:hypothetical protein
LIVLQQLKKYNYQNRYNRLTILTTMFKTNGNLFYTTVMVFDKNETDLRSAESPEKESLTNYFLDLIKNQHHNKTYFYVKKV